jgi:DNA processing protein
MFVATTIDRVRSEAVSAPLAEGASVLSLMEATRGANDGLIRLLRDTGSARAVVEGRARVRGRRATLARALAGQVGAEDLSGWVDVLEHTLARSPGTRFVPITDPEFPAGLADLPGSPPFLFVRGELPALPAVGVAVVGSRAVSPEGRVLAREVSSLLAHTGSVVVSGLATGVDGEAHCACLDAGGITVASLPTGVDRIYPSEHENLAWRIAGTGALVSRFWPDSPPRRDAFRLRNIVTSGIAAATVVIEAGAASGARMQARIALSQGRPVILMRALVQREPWARRAAERRGVLVAGSAEEVVEAVRQVAPRPAPRQLALF